MLVVAAAADAGFAMELLLGGAATVSFDGRRVWVGTSLRAMVLGGRIMDVGRGLGGGGMAALSSDCLPLSLPLLDVSSLIAASLPSLEILRMNDCGSRLRRLDCFDVVPSSPAPPAADSLSLSRSAGLCLPVPIC